MSKTAAENTLARLQELYEARNTLTTPATSTDDDQIKSVRADIFYWAGHVSGVVGRVLVGDSVQAEWLKPWTDLDRQLAELLASKPQAEQQILEDYRHYKEKWDEMLALANTVLQERANTP